MAYATVAQLRDYAGIDDARHDGLLTLLIARAQKRIDEHVGFSFEAAADTTRTFDAKSIYKGGHLDGRALLFDTWAYQLTSVTNGDGTVITSTYYVTEPRNRTPFYGIKLLASSGYAWESDSDGDPEGAISVVGRFAYGAAVPADITHACLRLSLWYYRQRDSSTDLDRPLLAEGVTILPSAIPADVTEILAHYAWRVG